jgi:DNA helicase-2/ATP-dependent DNA helicase PcrA
MAFMSRSILKHLNKHQQEAVTAPEGPLLILAGAGSGKTRCITHRIAYLIEEKNVNPENILLVTFTNKAATEMKERLRRLIGEVPPLAGTFHSFCARLLRFEGNPIGILPSFLIYDEADQLEAVKQAMANLKISSDKYKPKSFLNIISEAKNELISALEYPQFARGQFLEIASLVYLEYQKILSKYQALDFDDLLFDTVKLFNSFPDLLKKYQDRFHHLLVDEYQDTNTAQYVLTKYLSGRHHNLYVVGDCSQSIYMWRGANFRNILNLKKDFPDIKIINLEQNYRSTQKILSAANNVIKKNKSHPVLNLWTKNDPGEKVKIFKASSELDEANFIISKIKKIKSHHKNFKFSDFAVLYRTNAQSRVFEESFLHEGIPYLLVGGIRFYARREIKDCLAFLRHLINPADKISFKRIEKLGKKRLTLFIKFQKKEPRLNNFTTVEILDKILKVTAYLEMFDEENPEDISRLENIKELRSVATEFPNLYDFLENVALVEQEQIPQNQSKIKTTSSQKDAVTLMTMHAAKGLEFEVVFMVGMEEGLFPHSRSMQDLQELEEERRLCYVGMTRAKKKLFLTHAQRRLYFGLTSSNPASRFIADIPFFLKSNLKSKIKNVK